MNRIMTSASKVVFMLLSVALVWFTAMKIVPADKFVEIVLMVFTYYFVRNKPVTAQ